MRRRGGAAGGFIGRDHLVYISSVLSHAPGIFSLVIAESVEVASAVDLIQGQSAMMTAAEADLVWSYTGNGAAFQIDAGAKLEINGLTVAASSGIAFRVAAAAILLGTPMLSNGPITCAGLRTGVYAPPGLECAEAAARVTIGGPCFISSAGEALPLSFVKYSGPVPADFVDAIGKHAAGLYTLNLGADFQASAPLNVEAGMHVAIVGGPDTPDWSCGACGAGNDAGGDAFAIASGGFLILDRLALPGTLAFSNAHFGVVAFEDCAVDGAPLTVQVPTPWSGTAGQLAAALAAGLSPTVADPQCFEEATYDAVEAFISHARGPFCRRAGAFAAQPLLGACTVEACEGLCGAADAGCGAACAAMPAALLAAGVTGQQFVAGTAAGAPPPPFAVPSVPPSFAMSTAQNCEVVARSPRGMRTQLHYSYCMRKPPFIPDQAKGISCS